MSVCNFCGDDTTLTREDLIPRWMANLKPGGVRVKTVAGHRNIRQWTTVGDRVELVARAFCHPCNHGWMSRLEVDAKPYLLPMVLGREVHLTATAQAIISAWTLKTAMAMEFAGASSRPTYFTASERKTFASLQTPPDGVAIFLAHYVGTQAFAMSEDHINWHAEHSNWPRNDKSVPGYTCTMLFGALVTQVLAIRGEGGLLLFKARADYRPAELQVWPLGRAAVWPPKVVLDDAEFPRYVTRWVTASGGEG
jgi:hypothetical protein